MFIKRAKNDFSVNPYKAGKKLLDPKCYCSLRVDQETLDQHKSSNLIDNKYDIPLGNLEGPKISKFLFKIFQTCFKRCEIPIQWRSAQEIYIPKVSSPCENKLSDFRPIALLNVEGKLFFSLVSKRLETHLIHNNKFINNSIQKGCMEKIPGCWEHLSMVWHALKEARAQKSNLAVIWLGNANAYRSIPHEVIVFALHRYHSASDLLKHTTKEFSVNRFLNQQQVLGLLAALFFSNFFLGWYEHHT